jgi:hypothetical protein
MLEFNSLNDWPLVDQQLRRNVQAIHNYSHRRTCQKMLQNLQDAITLLSKAEISQRRTGYNNDYVAALATVQHNLSHLRQWLMFATLIDTNPE